MLKKFILLFPVLLLLFSFVLIKPSFAVSDNDLNEFCQARNGNLVNLETWYSGKCFDRNAFQSAMGLLGYTAEGASELIQKVSGVDPYDVPLPSQYSGQYRGFSDIVILDLITRLQGDDPNGPFGLSDGAIPAVSKFLATIIGTPPASSYDYIASIGQNLQNHSLVKPAMAAEGFGFVALQPVIKMWRGLRNAAYAVYILIFVLYGFMIMFRVKIDPKIVTSFELAIPKLITTLLLITFSYAIAGLMIDLMYLLSSAAVSAISGSLQLNLIEIPEIGLKLGDLMPNGGTDWVQGKLGLFGVTLLAVWKVLIGRQFSQILSLIFGLPTIIFQVLNVMPQWAAISLLIKLVLIIGILYSLLRIMLAFLQSYAKIILSIIFSPIILLGNVLPGNDAFGTWVRGLFAELSVFPATIILFMVAITLMGSSMLGGTGAEASIWTPPGLGGVGITNSARGAGALLGIGIIFLAPKLVDMIRDALSIKPFKYGDALKEGLEYGWAGTYAGATSNKLTGWMGKGGIRGAIGGFRQDISNTAQGAAGVVAPLDMRTGKPRDISGRASTPQKIT